MVPPAEPLVEVAAAVNLAVCFSADSETAGTNASVNREVVLRWELPRKRDSILRIAERMSL